MAMDIRVDTAVECAASGDWDRAVRRGFGRVR